MGARECCRGDNRKCRAADHQCRGGVCPQLTAPPPPRALRLWGSRPGSLTTLTWFWGFSARFPRAPAHWKRRSMSGGVTTAASRSGPSPPSSTMGRFTRAAKLRCRSPPRAKICAARARGFGVLGFGFGGGAAARRGRGRRQQRHSSARARHKITKKKLWQGSTMPRWVGGAPAGGALHGR